MVIWGQLVNERSFRSLATISVIWDALNHLPCVALWAPPSDFIFILFFCTRFWFLNGFSEFFRRFGFSPVFLSFSTKIKKYCAKKHVFFFFLPRESRFCFCKRRNCRSVRDGQLSWHAERSHQTQKVDREGKFPLIQHRC